MDSDRLEKLIIRYENTLLRTACAILDDLPGAEEVVYDTFLRLWEKDPAFESEAHEKAWLLRVTVNGCRSALRARKRRPAVPLTEAVPAPTQEEREIWDAVAALAPGERAAVHLFYYEGYSAEEIAVLTRRRPGTVRAQLSRARARLREWLS